MLESRCVFAEAARKPCRAGAHPSPCGRVETPPPSPPQPTDPCAHLASPCSSSELARREARGGEEGEGEEKEEEEEEAVRCLRAFKDATKARHVRQSIMNKRGDWGGQSEGWRCIIHDPIRSLLWDPVPLSPPHTPFPPHIASDSFITRRFTSHPLCHLLGKKDTQVIYIYWCFHPILMRTSRLEGRGGGE